MKTTVTTEELVVPTGIIIQVADLLLENEITHRITETDEENDTLTIEVEYSRDERDAIHEITDLIDDYDGDDSDEDDEEEDDDDNSKLR